MRRRWPAALLLLVAASALAGPRARDLGIPFDGTPGPLDAITDVAGVTVGHTTLIAGEGKLVVGEGPVRTGVTAILPRGRGSVRDPVFAGTYVLNGNGEMTGLAWVEESGLLLGPVMLTNTHSVGVVHEAVIAWQLRQPDLPSDDELWWSLAVVGETFDWWLNDINGFHVHPEHAVAALEGATGGAVAEGAVGGGTGTVSFGFKGGIGTASRVVRVAGAGYTVGALVQTNFGRREQLRIAGVPVGRDITEAIPYAGAARHKNLGDLGSIIVVVATDAPLLPHQLKRIARRVALGVARTGGVAMNDSGELFIAFSTAATGVGAGAGAAPVALRMLPNGSMDPLFTATVEATEEAIVNALVAGRSMTGIDGHFVMGLPHERVQALLRQRGVLVTPAR
jgi:D-aminopeptidase